MRAFVLLLLFLAVPVSKPAYGQSEFLSIAPLQYFATYDRSADIEANIISAGIVRSIPVSSLLPQVSMDSYFNIMRLGAGLGFNDAGSGKARLKAHVTGAEFEVQKMPWAAQLELLDVDAAGFIDIKSNWISLGFGPGVNIGNDIVGISTRILASGAVNSTRFGSSVFRNIGETAETTRLSLRYGLSGRFGLVIANRAAIAIDYSLNSYTTSLHIENSNWSVNMTVDLTEKWSVIGSWKNMELTIDEVSEDSLRSDLDFDIRQKRAIEMRVRPRY